MGHTKGEWILDKDGYIICNNEAIAFTASLSSRVDESRLNGESWMDMRKRTENDRINHKSEEHANAKLIAAAPDLLNALIQCKELIYFLSSDKIKDIDTEFYDMINNAINKATK